MLLQNRLTAGILAALFATFAATSARADQNDPSGRAARLSYTHGATSFSPAGETEWVDTIVNRPLVSGDRVWADRDGRAEIQVGGAALRLNANTNFELVNLDDRTTQVELTQGTLYVRLRQYSQDQNFEIDTPTMAIALTQAGQYRIEVDPDGQSTTVIVTQGSAAAYGDNAQYPLRAGDRVRFHSVDLRDAEQLSVAPPDDFDRFSISRDERAERSASLRYVNYDVVGADDLDEYGSWSSQGEYGQVWYPSHVDANWAPYSDGHWIWQDPWGWTWIDNAPWGFAPAHYGRWVSVDSRWGWVPGPRDDRAIYAPALVAFVGGGGFSIGISAGGAGPIGWFALGAHDVYEPPYHASRDYFTRVNVTNTTINNVNITNVYNDYSSDKPLAQASFANRTIAGAVTAVPGNVFVNAQPVRTAAVKVDGKMLAATQVTRVAAVAPSARSVMGSAPAARVKPANAVLERKVVAQTPPPPPPVPFAARQQELQRSPGRPLPPSAVATLQPGAATAAHANVRVLGPQANAVNVRSAGPAHGAPATGVNEAPKGGPAAAPRDAVATDQRETAQGPQQKGHKGQPSVEQRDSPAAQAQGKAEQNAASPVPRDASMPRGRKPEAATTPEPKAPPQQDAPQPAGPQHREVAQPQSVPRPNERKRDAPSPPEQQQSVSPPPAQQRQVASPPQPQQDAPPARERKRDVVAPPEQDAPAPQARSQRAAAPPEQQPQQDAPPARERKRDVAAPPESPQNASPAVPPHRVAPQPQQAAPQRADVPPAPQDQRGAPPAHEPKRNAPPQQQGDSAPAPENGKGKKATKKKDQGKDADATDGDGKTDGGGTPPLD